MIFSFSDGKNSHDVLDVRAIKQNIFTMEHFRRQQPHQRIAKLVKTYCSFLLQARPSLAKCNTRTSCCKMCKLNAWVTGSSLFPLTLRDLAFSSLNIDLTLPPPAIKTDWTKNIRISITASKTTIQWKICVHSKIVLLVNFCHCPILTRFFCE